MTTNEIYTRSEPASVVGGRSAGTGMYEFVHEDAEHRPNFDHGMRSMFKVRSQHS